MVNNTKDYKLKFTFDSFCFELQIQYLLFMIDVFKITYIITLI